MTNVMTTKNSTNCTNHTTTPRNKEHDFLYSNNNTNLTHNTQSIYEKHLYEQDLTDRDSPNGGKLRLGDYIDTGFGLPRSLKSPEEILSNISLGFDGANYSQFTTLNGLSGNGEIGTGRRNTGDEASGLDGLSGQNFEFHMLGERESYKQDDSSCLEKITEHAERVSVTKKRSNSVSTVNILTTPESTLHTPSQLASTQLIDMNHGTSQDSFSYLEPEEKTVFKIQIQNPDTHHDSSIDSGH